MNAALRSWTPAQSIERFGCEFDDLFDKLVGGGHRKIEHRVDSTVPPVESYLDGDVLVIRADLPGIDPNDVKVSVTDDILRIEAVREQSKQEKSRYFIRREIRYGEMERLLKLPARVAAEQIKASYRNGVLELTIAMPKPLSRKVQVEIDRTRQLAGILHNGGNPDAATPRER